jgi:signal transduction histidine kinase/DNA-binding LacI/PurR family transcriptional regulator/AraC-like DNA-binding protein
LIHNRRLTIGVLAGWQFYWTATPLSYLDPLYRGIRLAAATHGCNLLLGCGMGSSATSGDPIRPAWCVPSHEADFVPIGPWNTDGLIAVNPLHSATRSQYLQALRASGYPVVYVGSGESGPTVVADNEGGIHEAVRHLVAHGHRQIAFIAGSPEDLYGDSGARLRAFQSALHVFDLPADPRLIAHGRHILIGGQAAMQQILASGARFTAVLASNDESALGAMQALHAAGRRIPEDIAIIGFDDRPESAVQTPPLSSVHLSLFQIGVQAVTLLLEELNGAAKGAALVKVRTRLVPRASCGCSDNASTALLHRAEISEVDVAPHFDPTTLAHAMSTAVLAESQTLNANEVEALCLQFLDAFFASIGQADDARLKAVLGDLLMRTVEGGDDAQIWQLAISLLRNALPQIMGAIPGIDAAAAQPDAMLDEARKLISKAMWRQHRRYAVDERWIMDRIGLLTANLLNALDEMQVFQMFAQHLPTMDIHGAWLAEFVAEPATPDGVPEWSEVRSLTAPEEPGQSVRTKAFPQPALFGEDAPFSMALLPLVSPRGQRGFVAFDSKHLTLYGAIVQQLAAALNTAQLYREATEGRRLAEEANQMKSRFLSTVSHELRTPLNLIVGTSAILLQESDESLMPLPEQIHRDVERIHSSAQHLSGLIGDVLDLASSNAGQLRLAQEFVDISQALRMVDDAGRRLAVDKGLAWHAELPEVGPWVWGDRTRLRQVALNLVNNAVKFTARGSVALQVTSTSSTVTVVVRDTGIGIPADEQAAIFDEFRRTERSIARGYGGLGLGLAISRRLVELHGGELGAYSSGEEGAGATFFFTLPTVEPPVKPDERPPIRAVAAPDILVLKAPGKDPTQLITSLQQRGFRVESAHLDDNAAWQERLATGAYSAVVLDISHAPVMGWRVLKMIKENPATQEVPVLIYAAAEPGGALLELDYLTKPIELTELTRALDQHWLLTEMSRPARSILVVDDDPETLEMHIRIVQTQSRANRVLSARNGREALEILERAPVDLVLLDLLMSELDGFGVLELMRARPATRDIPVIVVTGQTLTEAEMMRLNQGVATIMVKGLYSLDETLAHLETALEHRRKLSSDAQHLVRRAMAFLHAKYAETLTRRDIAEHVGLDEDYLTYCFRQELGITPIAYLNRYRVNLAKTLLKQSNQSITEIALAVGFSDSGYFSRVFRREVGMAPDAYRRT